MGIPNVVRGLHPQRTDIWGDLVYIYRLLRLPIKSSESKECLLPRRLGGDLVKRGVTPSGGEVCENRHRGRP